MSSTICSSKLLNLEEVSILLEDILLVLENGCWKSQAHPHSEVQTPLRRVWGRVVKASTLNLCTL